jgi:hypothetical protein
MMCCSLGVCDWSGIEDDTIRLRGRVKIVIIVSFPFFLGFLLLFEVFVVDYRMADTMAH